MYNKLFDIFYSDRIPEDTKFRIIEGLQDQLNEKYEFSPYVEYLNTLIGSDITDEALDEVISMTFESLDEELVEDITEEFIRASVISYISEAGMKLYGDPRPIGLRGLDKEINKSSAGAPAQKSSATSKLKSAVGKVKDWFERSNNKPATLTGLRKLEAEQDARLKKAAEEGVVPKAKSSTITMSQPTASSASSSTPQSSGKMSIEDRIKRHNERVGKQATSTPTLTNNEAPLMMGYKKEKKRISDEEIKNKIDKHNERVGKQATSSPVIKSDAPFMMGQKKEEEKKVEKVEAPTAETSTTEAPAAETSSSSSKNTSRSKRNKLTDAAIAAAEDTGEKEKVATTGGKRGGKKNNGGKNGKNGGKNNKKKGSDDDLKEALEELGCLLAHTNISEALVGELSEMISNRKAAQAAVERDYKDFTKAVNALNRIEEAKAKTGFSSVTQEQQHKLMEEAEEKGARYERFKALAHKKFGVEC